MLLKGAVTSVVVGVSFLLLCTMIIFLKSNCLIIVR